MPHCVETMVFSIDELQGIAREHARDWYRRHAFDDDWHGFIFDDFDRICAILGLSLRQRLVRIQGGGTRSEPCIFFSGFSSQGDGACFEGVYRYAHGMRTHIRDYAPQTTDLHDLADRLSGVQRRNFYGLQASVRQCGRYSHEYSMMILASRRSVQDVSLADENILIEALRDLSRWLYRQLEGEYAYLTSNEQVDEGLRSNAFTFTEDGRRFG